MPWFKVDDKLHDHRKARAAGPAAMGLWVLAGSWSADNLTDGFIPASLLPRWGRQREASRLVEVGLWHADEENGEKGWRFHEWAERQPTRAQKTAEREAKSEAGRIGGLKSGQSRREAKAKQSASPLVELPSRPVPSRPEPSTSNEVETAPERGTKLPKDWKPTVEHEARALAADLVLGREVDKFKAHADEKGRRAKNWNAAFTRWLMTAEEYANRNGRTRPADNLPLAHQIEEPPPGLDAREYDEWFRAQAAKHKAAGQ